MNLWTPSRRIAPHLQQQARPTLLRQQQAQASVHGRCCCDFPLFHCGGTGNTGTGLRRLADDNQKLTTLWSNQNSNYANYCNYDKTTSAGDSLGAYDPKGVVYTYSALPSDPAKIRLLDLDGNVQWTYEDPDGGLENPGRTFIRGDKVWWILRHPTTENHHIRCINRLTGASHWKYDTASTVIIGSAWVDDNQDLYYLRHDGTGLVIDDVVTGRQHQTYDYKIVKINNAGSLVSTTALSSYGYDSLATYLVPSGDDFIVSAANSYKLTYGGATRFDNYILKLGKGGGITQTKLLDSGGFNLTNPRITTVKGAFVFAISNDGGSVRWYSLSTLDLVYSVPATSVGLGSSVLGVVPGPRNDIYVWTSNAGSVKQVSKALITAVDPVAPPNNTFTVTIGAQSVSATGNTNVSTTRSDLVTALNASVLSNFTPITWSGSAGEVIGTTDAFGGTFTATLTVTGVGLGTVTSFRTTAVVGADVGRINLTTKVQLFVQNTALTDAVTRLASRPNP